MGFLEIYKATGLYGEFTNIGMNEEITIGDLVKLISELMNVDIKIFSETERIRPENSEVERLMCNNNKISTNTNWTPKYNLKKGLLETIEFLKENLNHYKSNIYNV